MTIAARAFAFASRWFSPERVSGVFEPLVADWQREWLDAESSRRRKLAHVRGLSAFACAALISSAELFRATPRPLAAQVRNRVALFMLIAIAGLSTPVLLSVETRLSPSLILYLFSSVFVFALPFSTIIGADAIRRHDELPAHTQRGAALKFVTFTLLLMLFVTALVVPAAREQWLRSGTADAIAAARYISPGDAARLSSLRAATAIMPPLILWIRWRALDRPRRRSRFVSPMPTSLAVTLAIVGYLLLFSMGSLAELWWSFPRGSGAWLPVLAFAFAAMPEQWRSQREA